MSATAAKLDAGRRERLSRIADVMLPSTDTMPSATASGALGATLDAVLEARPDLVGDLRRAIDEIDVELFEIASMSELLRTDEPAYVALTTVAAAAYYQSPEVRERIGYPGQVAKTYDAYAYVEWVGEGLLDPVIERGAIWRDPRGADSTEMGP